MSFRVLDFVDFRDGRGFGRVASRDGDLFEVLYTAAPGADPVDRKLVEKRQFADARKRLYEGHQVWVSEGSAWRRGVVITTIGDKYQVAVGGVPRVLAPVELEVTSEGFADPLALLNQGASGPANVTRGRLEALEEFSRQRRHSKNLAGALSASIHLYRHQIAVALRVLRDPRRRFILADEVGLGKTIEAGLICREISLVEPDTSFVFVVPDVLIHQWERELLLKFLLGLPGDTVSVVGHSELGDLTDTNFDVLVVDEAHRLVANEDDFASLGALSGVARDLLLLSATPLRSDGMVLSRLLHLVDPNAYRLSGFDGFSSALETRRELAYRIAALSPNEELELLEDDLTEFLNSYPDDEVLAALTKAVWAAPDTQRPARVAAVRNHLVDTYRISKRLIRTRRSTVRRDMPVAGRSLKLAEFSELDHGAALDGFISEMLSFGRVANLTGDDIRNLVVDLLEVCSRAGTGVDGLLAEWGPTLSAPDPEGFDAVVTEFRPQLVVGGRRYLRLLASEVKARINDGKVVVATSSSELAQELLALLREQHGTLAANAHLETATVDDNRQAVDAFTDADYCKVLVIDGSGEEGLNLQVARTLVNADLTPRVNRLEQRFGRLDRFSMNGRAVLVVPSMQSDWWQGLIRFLRDGTGIFNESVATAQRSLAMVESEVSDAVAAVGLSGLVNELDGVRQRIELEAQQVSELEEIESSDIELLFSEDEWRVLVDAEEEGHRIESVVKELTHDRRGIGLRMRVVPESPGVFQYGVRDLKVREDLSPYVAVAAIGHRTFRRPVALRHQVRLVRIGDPMVDLLERIVATDSQALATAVWRTSHKAPAPDPPLPFLLLVLKGGFVGADDLPSRLRQIGRSLIPEWFERKWISPHGPAPSQAVSGFLDPDPFRTRAQRMGFADQGVEGAAWDYVRESVVDLDAFLEETRASIDGLLSSFRSQLVAEGEAGLARMRLLEFGNGGETSSAEGPLYEGLQTPAVTLAAAQLIVVSSKPPPWKAQP